MPDNKADGIQKETSGKKNMRKDDSADSGSDGDIGPLKPKGKYVSQAKKSDVKFHFSE